ncbi:RNA-binding protein 24-like isoform X1 [Asparagus officinalis]|uniref:RNA-binding protein 24-like isoform X1 n=1 Tax=Asparagus officinalis TaxID=4686 RepID=UPI00098E6F88|nr:RNA-binding protein 24-like isoform X1 [Asparagus officinalis]
MSPVAGTGNYGGQFGDTTYTKVFVGGLAWETQKETMRKYFEQFGDILEAVVITDKNSGRSKGYGFVTFSEPEAAMRACVDPAPVIDGRRANCNLASLGVQRSTPTTPQNGCNRSFRVMKSFPSAAAGIQSGLGTAFPTHTAAPHYAIHQGIPYNVYGYPPYSAEYNYPSGYYNVYGGATAQYPMYGGTSGAFYPYIQYGQGGAAAYGHAAQGYNTQYPHMFQYPAALASSAAVTGFAHHYGGSISFATNPPAQPGMNMALPAPTLPTPTIHNYRLLPAHFTPSAASEQPLA